MDVKFIRTNRRKNGHVGGFILEAKKHVTILLLFLVMFSGLLLGNFLVKSDSGTYQAVKNLFDSYLSSLPGQTFLRNFLLQLAINTASLAINLVFGLCAIGFPVPIISTLIKGLSIGALSSFLYMEYALKGFGYCMLVFYPVQIISSLILMSSGKESFGMSVSLLRTLTENRQKIGENNEIKLYLLRFLIFVLISCVLSLISAVLSVYVVKLFNF